MSVKFTNESISNPQYAIITDADLNILAIGSQLSDQICIDSLLPGRPLLSKSELFLKSKTLKDADQIESGQSYRIIFSNGYETFCVAHEINNENNNVCGYRFEFAPLPSLSKSAPDGLMIFEVDENGNPVCIINSNPACHALFKFSAQELKKLSFTDIFKDLPPTLNFQSDSAETIWESQALTASNETITVELHTRLFKESGKDFLSVAARDTRERNLVFQGLRQMEKVEIFGQLAGGIAHDFNNVLAGIIGFGELALRKANGNSVLQRHITNIISKADGAANLVKRLMAFSHQQEPEYYPLNVNSIIREILPFLERISGETVNLETHLQSRIPNIHADYTAIEQILTNLVINARDAMPDGGTVSISTESLSLGSSRHDNDFVLVPGQYVLLSIRDSGIGMNEQVQKRIFEPFFSTKSKGEGTGLGLAIVSGLAKQHNAEVNCSSTIGEGTQFDIYFPAYQEEFKPENHSEIEKPATVGSETVLLVEDDPDLLESMSSGLRHYGYKVLFARDGLEALEVFEKNTSLVDVIIADMIMPEIGGVELKMLIEKDFPQIPFLLITGTNDKFEPGIQYLKKPFHIDQLAAEVRNSLNN